VQTQGHLVKLGLIAGAMLNLAPGTPAALEHPYGSVALRNSFHLRCVAASDPGPETPLPPALSAIEVAVTGVTDVCGRRQALLELRTVDQQTARPILGEGDRLDGIEIVQIDVRESRVVARIHGKETVLTFHPGEARGVLPSLSGLTIPAGRLSCAIGR
jgi:hypothetical protein